MTVDELRKALECIDGTLVVKLHVRQGDSRGEDVY